MNAASDTDLRNLLVKERLHDLEMDYRGVTRDRLHESKAAAPNPSQPKYMILRPSLARP